MLHFIGEARVMLKPTHTTGSSAMQYGDFISVSYHFYSYN